ncbi:Hpt domain-containing protein [Flavicella marina]|uniref:Hpt domain-containing protein n=1 Tax=Flavicella marina TaxID=1475951 RepID=UPI0012651ACE|nr:Hpt domain-containing protein [Flavicella marina]
MSDPNLNYIKELSGGDVEFEKKIVTILKEELPVEIHAYFKHFRNQDFIKTAEIVHKIKHKISILGLEKGCQIANLYEQKLREEKTEGNQRFEILLEQMTLFLKKVTL